jgi:hypothetical protein
MRTSFEITAVSTGRDHVKIMDTNDAAPTLPNIDEIRLRTEEYVREEPVKSVGIALVAGIFLTILPVFSIVLGLLRLGTALLRPALLVLGGLKLYEELQKRYSA